jgi:hypothetical protein
VFRERFAAKMREECVRENIRKGRRRFWDLVDLGEALCKEARIEPPSDRKELALIAEECLKQTGVSLDD